MIRINIDKIVEVARDAGLDPLATDWFCKELQRLDRAPSDLVDHRVGKAMKVAGRLGEDPAAAELLRLSVEFVGRLFLCQWNLASDVFNSLCIVAGMKEDNHFRQSLVETIKALSPEGFPERPDRAAPGHARDLITRALRAAYVLACDTPDCDQRYDCWETRRWGCFDDPPREVKDHNEKAES